MLARPLRGPDIGSVTRCHEPFTLKLNCEVRRRVWRMRPVVRIGGEICCTDDIYRVRFDGLDPRLITADRELVLFSVAPPNERHRSAHSWTFDNDVLDASGSKKIGRAHCNGIK